MARRSDLLLFTRLLASLNQRETSVRPTQLCEKRVPFENTVYSFSFDIRDSAMRAVSRSMRALNAIREVTDAILDSFDHER